MNLGEILDQAYNRADQAFDDHTMGVARKLLDTYYYNPRDYETWVQERQKALQGERQMANNMTTEMLTEDEMKQRAYEEEKRAIKAALEEALRISAKNAGYKDTSQNATPAVSMDYGSPMQIKAPNVNIQGQPTNINDLFSVYD